MSIIINLNTAGINYTENEGDLILFDSATVFSDGDSLVDTVKITLDSASSTESLAVFPLPAGYTSFYDSNTGLLTISSGTGDISDANWESVLRSAQYSNSSNNPSGARIITVVASDTVGAETSDSNAAIDTITITAINDAPEIIGDLLGTAAEGSTYLLNTDDLGEADPDDEGAELTYTVTSQTHGTVKLDGFATTFFTAQDVMDGKVSFSHDGSETVNADFNFSLADGGENGAPPATGTFNFTIVPANDIPTGAVTIDGTAQENATLTANTGTIADNDGLGTLSYQWLRDNVAIGSATDSIYMLEDADVGKQISVQVSYTDGHGTAESLTSAQTVVVANVNDIPTGAVTISGTAQENATLTADTSTIADNDGLGTLSYQWLRDNVAIGSATDSIYMLEDADVGKPISVQVNYTDGQGAAETLTSAQTAVVANVNDIPTGAVTIEGAAQENATLTANAGTIADNDGLGTFSYQWLRDNVVIDSATDSAYMLEDADVGKQIRVQVSYTDGHGTAESLTSAQTAVVINANQAPALIAALVDQAVQYDTVGWSYDASASFNDEDISDSLSYGATLANDDPLSIWIHIDATTGLITGSPGFGDRGTYALKVTATDTHGLSADGTLTVAVTAFDAGRLLVSTNGSDMLAGTLFNDTVTYAYAADPVAVSLAITASQNTGSAGSDTLTNIDNLIGSDFNDNLTGNSAANQLDGGAGADALRGAAGNDTYIVDNTGDIITETFNAGNDIVNSSVTYTLSGNVENLTLIGVSSINGIGNSLANTIIGNMANNTLNGGTGADTLFGGLGDDNYVVDNSGDSVTESFDEGTDRVSSNMAYILPDNVENLTLTGTLAIDGTGNNLANILLGNSAANQLDGGAGADVLKGAAGDDTYIIDHTGDIITETLNAGNDIVYSSVTYKLSNNVENLILTGTSAISGTGNSLSNLIIGNAAINTLNGGTGADTLIGGLGNDIYTVDNVGDIIMEYLDEGVDKVNTSVSYTLPAHVENLTLTGTAAINGAGNDLANIIVGNTANNQLNGGAGNDTLNGGAGNNILTGGTGKDYFQFRTADHINGGRMDTIIDYSVIDDTIKLDKAVFTVFTNPIPSPIAAGELIIGSQALDSNDFIIYNSGTGALLYDADGNGSDAAVQFAMVSIGLAMTNADFHVI